MPPSPPGRATSPYHRPTSLSVSVVVPVHDVAELPPILRGLPATHEVIVVSGGGDQAAAAVRAACPGAFLVRPTRAGRGNALACGVAASTGDVVVTLDGATSTDPAEIPAYLDALAGGADAVFGSRYRDGGRDLTRGRVRRWSTFMLVFLLNALFGGRRTDVGFGCAAFRRDALDLLGLPDAAAADPTWGDGPEVAALLAVRAAARGLSVAEVGSTAHPQPARGSRTDRTTLRHWLRAAAAEFRSRHPAPIGPNGIPRVRTAATIGPIGRTGIPRSRPRYVQPPAVVLTAPTRATDETGAGRRAVNRDEVPAARAEKAAQREAQRGTQPATPALIPRPHLTEAGRAAGARREVGAKRRRIEGIRQRPDLRLINGGGQSSGRVRGRLRPVPRENP